MSLLSRFRVLTKILAVVLLLSGVAGAIAYVGIGSLKVLSDTAARITRNGNSAVLAARMNVALLEISRAELRLAADPRAEARAAAKREIEAQTQLFNERFKRLRAFGTVATGKHAPAIAEH